MQGETLRNRSRVQIAAQYTRLAPYPRPLLLLYGAIMYPAIMYPDLVT